ncbi:MAG: hypothetical protein Q7T56_14705 [Nocardioidaceae bacterium]|nr:hypothetical protein [Nocardioidaceae bacterium]
MRAPLRTTLLIAAGHAVVRVLALLGLERLLVDGRLDGLLRPLGLYSDDPLGAGLTAFMLIAAGAGLLALADGLLRRRATAPWLQVAVWGVVCVAYGVASALTSHASGTSDDLVFTVLLMGGLAAFGAVPGIATGTAVRLALTPTRRPTADPVPVPGDH